MNKLLKYIGVGIFVGWSIAMLVNYSIYEYTTMQTTLFHPIIDGILFMALMVGIYFLSIFLYKNKEANASILLGILGVIAISIAFYFYT
ncbi:hypothetical protein [Evansella cellulosilytica]|uniref:Uncharacterized protein n=1 Tax=Evansella cellulosilytica (strain ATCC 21833 / DSM 2522 / FERM P-1141 / JCM 9156 / N-4) TaxID=649639 RepID=E6TYR0_EVAC2|nr:hypothetical protein [Evansella cellulosilytica]ADU31245.1 hypothetical protein Bcell_2995 [Evansella cellulosilytica DSM 2522]